MQVLKDEIRDNIRLSAINEFKEKGYETATMRAIALGAGISVGNLYRYYKNKDCLFEEIVSSVYKHITTQTHNNCKLEFIDINLMEHVELIERIINARKGRRDELYILLEKSKGSKYQDVKGQIIKHLEKQFNEIIMTCVNIDKEIVKGETFAKAVATSLIEGVCTIIRECKDEKSFVENIIQYVEFTIKSMLRTLFAIRDNKISFRRLSNEEIRDRINNHNTCDFGGSKNNK